MTNNNHWIENTGTVPDGIGPDTKIEVEYRSGRVFSWVDTSEVPNNDPDLWSIENWRLDIIRWRFV